MARRNALSFALRLLITLAVPTALMAGSVRLLLSYEFLEFEYQRPGFPADPFGFTTVDRIAYGKYAIDYLFNDEPIESLAKVQVRIGGNCAGTDACPLFHQRELRHMGDVKKLLRFGFATAMTIGLLTGVTMLMTIHTPMAQDAIRRGLRDGSRLTLCLILATSVAALLSWHRAFDAFHNLFFASGTWRFAYSDSLIRLYPERIFIDAAGAIAIFTSLGAIVIMLLTSLWDRHAP